MKSDHNRVRNLTSEVIFDNKVALLCLISLFSLIVIKNAWVGDDAFITVRTIENFLSGYGLTHNIAERVQTFTHPLWMFLQAGIYFIVNRLFGIYFWAEFYYLNVLSSVIISTLVVFLLVFRNAASFLSSVIGVSILVLSKAFVDYSTSGLENPLSHLLLIIFFLIYLDGDRENQRRIFFNMRE